jgi:hypothetical protein
MVMKRVSGLLLVLFFAAVANGGLTYEGDVEYTAGTGQNEARIVIDFDFEQYFVFGYRWDGDASGWDALEAIATGCALEVDATDYGEWGMFVSDFDYPGGIEYDYGGEANVGWAYYVGDNESWSISSMGVSLRSLNDGDWDSWVWTNYSADWMTAYRRPGGMPVPEPVTLCFFGAGILLFRRFRFCSVHS